MLSVFVITPLLFTETTIFKPASILPALSNKWLTTAFVAVSSYVPSPFQSHIYDIVMFGTTDIALAEASNERVSPALPLLSGPAFAVTVTVVFAAAAAFALPRPWTIWFA